MCPGYDTKQSDGEAQVIQKLWGIQNALSLPSLPGPHCAGVEAPDIDLSMSQIELYCVLMLKWIAWNKTVLTCNYVRTKIVKWPLRSTSAGFMNRQLSGF